MRELGLAEETVQLLADALAGVLLVDLCDLIRGRRVCKGFYGHSVYLLRDTVV
eukprot:COSAG03_NODE_6556_length_1040_cov_3.445271_2_plen_53_part_00